jgi:hypothetical protein
MDPLTTFGLFAVTATDAHLVPPDPENLDGYLVMSPRRFSSSSIDSNGTRIITANC